METNRCRDSLMLSLVLLIVFLAGYFPMKSIPFLLVADADHREYEANNFEENITISPDAIRAIDLNLQEGEKFEVVFTLKVKEGLPIDVWFVNQDHYLLLVNGAQFLFYIDGSEQEVAYTKKIVEVTENDIYKLVVINIYNYGSYTFEMQKFIAKTTLAIIL